MTVLALSTLIYQAIEGPEILAGAIQFDFANAISVALLLAGLSSLAALTGTSGADGKHRAFCSTTWPDRHHRCWLLR